MYRKHLLLRMISLIKLVLNFYMFLLFTYMQSKIEEISQNNLRMKVIFQSTTHFKMNLF